jgi:hypothetical protein
MHYQFVSLLSLVMDACYRDQATAESVVNNEVHSQLCMDGNKANPASLRRAVSLAAFDRDLDSSESIPSDHSSLYDAARASFIFEDENRILYQSTIIQDNGTSDEKVGNTFSLDPPAPSSLRLRRDEPLHALETITEQQSSSTLERSRSHSQVHGSLADSDPPSKQPKRSSLAVAGRATRRKAVSFDDSCSDLGPSHWRHGVLSPVLPTQPSYPPPFRSPTPPGLPSFGSIEALTYSPGFTIGSGSASQGGQHQGAASTDGMFRRRSHEGPRSPFYSGALRRLFGAPSPSGPPSTLPMHTIARADDGTAVRGRFAYRQSGHGVDLTRSFDRHPFHRSHMPVAISMFVDGVSRSNEARRSKSGGSHEGLGPSHVVDSSQGQAVGSSPSRAIPSSGLERLQTVEPQTLTTTSGISEPPLLSSQQAPEAPVPAGHDGVRLSTDNVNGNIPAMPSVRADSILNTAALPVVFPGVVTTDGTSETTADGHRKTTSFWIGIWKNISDTFCCGLEHEEDTTAALYPPPESCRRNGDNASFSSAAPTLALSRTRGSEFSQAGRRYSEPWRPAYGFHPGEMSASSVV